MGKTSKKRTISETTTPRIDCRHPKLELVRVNYEYPSLELVLQALRRQVNEQSKNFEAAPSTSVVLPENMVEKYSCLDCDFSADSPHGVKTHHTLAHRRYYTYRPKKQCERLYKRQYGIKGRDEEKRPGNEEGSNNNKRSKQTGPSRERSYYVKTLSVVDAPGAVRKTKYSPSNSKAKSVNMARRNKNNSSSRGDNCRNTGFQPEQITTEKANTPRLQAWKTLVVKHSKIYEAVGKYKCLECVFRADSPQDVKMHYTSVHRPYHRRQHKDRKTLWGLCEEQMPNTEDWSDKNETLNQTGTGQERSSDVMTLSGGEAPGAVGNIKHSNSKVVVARRKGLSKERRSTTKEGSKQTGPSRDTISDMKTHGAGGNGKYSHKVVTADRTNLKAKSLNMGKRSKETAMRPKRPKQVTTDEANTLDLQTSGDGSPSTSRLPHPQSVTNHKCGYCTYTTTNQELMDDHIMAYKRRKKCADRKNCPDCTFNSPSSLALKIHRLTAHSGKARSSHHTHALSHTDSAKVSLQVKKKGVAIRKSHPIHFIRRNRKVSRTPELRIVLRRCDKNTSVDKSVFDVGNSSLIADTEWFENTAETSESNAASPESSATPVEKLSINTGMPRANTNTAETDEVTVSSQSSNNTVGGQVVESETEPKGEEGDITGDALSRVQPDNLEGRYTCQKCRYRSDHPLDVRRHHITVHTEEHAVYSRKNYVWDDKKKKLLSCLTILKTMSTVTGNSGGKYNCLDCPFNADSPLDVKEHHTLIHSRDHLRDQSSVPKKPKRRPGRPKKDSNREKCPNKNKNPSNEDTPSKKEQNYPDIERSSDVKTLSLDEVRCLVKNQNPSNKETPREQDGPDIERSLDDKTLSFDDAPCVVKNNNPSNEKTPCKNDSPTKQHSPGKERSPNVKTLSADEAPCVVGDTIDSPKVEVAEPSCSKLIITKLALKCDSCGFRTNSAAVLTRHKLHAGTCFRKQAILRSKEKCSVTNKLPRKLLNNSKTVTMLKESERGVPASAKSGKRKYRPRKSGRKRKLLSADEDASTEKVPKSDDNSAPSNVSLVEEANNPVYRSLLSARADSIRAKGHDVTNVQVLGDLTPDLLTTHELWRYDRDTVTTDAPPTEVPSPTKQPVNNRDLLKTRYRPIRPKPSKTSSIVEQELLSVNQDSQVNTQHGEPVDAELFQCTHCINASTFKSHLKDHIAFVHGDNPKIAVQSVSLSYKCSRNKCTFFTKNASDLKVHEFFSYHGKRPSKVEHDGKLVYRCFACDWGTTYLPNYSRHIRANHPIQDEHYRCNKCKFVGGSLKELLIHQHVHFKPHPHKREKLTTANQRHSQRMTTVGREVPQSDKSSVSSSSNNQVTNIRVLKPVDTGSKSGDENVVMKPLKVYQLPDSRRNWTPITLHTLSGIKVNTKDDTAITPSSKPLVTRTVNLTDIISVLKKK